MKQTGFTYDISSLKVKQKVKIRLFEYCSIQESAKKLAVVC